MEMPEIICLSALIGGGSVEWPQQLSRIHLLLLVVHLIHRGGYTVTRYLRLKNSRRDDFHGGSG
jgi:hypothetical protein